MVSGTICKSISGLYNWAYAGYWLYRQDIVKCLSDILSPWLSSNESGAIFEALEGDTINMWLDFINVIRKILNSFFVI